MAAKTPEVTCAGAKTSKVPTRVKLLLYFYFVALVWAGQFCILIG
jgi:hypothetical protein